MTVSRRAVKFKRMYELISSCRWKVSVGSGRPSYVGSIERPYDGAQVRMQLSCGDCRCSEVDMGGTTLRQTISSAPARDRSVPRQRPPLRLVPPLSDAPPTTIDPPMAAIGEAASLVDGPATVVDAGTDLGASSGVRLVAEARSPADARLLDDVLLLDRVRRPASAERPRAARVAPRQPGQRPGHARRPIHLTRRGRVVVIALLALLVAGIVATFASTGHADAPTTPGSIVVHQGDTLWSIASRIHPHGSPTSTMVEIERLNHMPDGTVYVGQRLLVPRS
jgi:hypothetical protein